MEDVEVAKRPKVRRSVSGENVDKSASASTKNVVLDEPSAKRRSGVHVAGVTDSRSTQVNLLPVHIFHL